MGSKIAVFILFIHTWVAVLIKGPGEFSHDQGAGSGEVMQLGDSVIFFDDFDTPASYSPLPVKNATSKEYLKALASGRLLRKWNYSWDYSYDGDWRQAFYVVPDSAGYMEQAGRSASAGDYRVTPKVGVPTSASVYEISWKQCRRDNDPIFYHLGAGEKGQGGIYVGYQTQLPGTDKTVKDIYTLGALGEARVPGMAYMREWVQHQITVSVKEKSLRWTINDRLVQKGRIPGLEPGGHFAIRMNFDRGTRFDDVCIRVVQDDEW